MTNFYFSWLILSLAVSPASMQESLSERLDAGKQIYFEGRHLEEMTQLTRTRGPGILLSASSVVAPVPIVNRPSSCCTTTLTAQLSRISQSST